jgi:hypothetical protein
MHIRQARLLAPCFYEALVVGFEDFLAGNARCMIWNEGPSGAPGSVVRGWDSRT